MPRFSVLLVACLAKSVFSYPHDVSVRSPATIGPPIFGQACSDSVKPQIQAALRTCAQLAGAATTDALIGNGFR
jgi:hypothetical protein